MKKTNGQLDYDITKKKKKWGKGKKNIKTEENIGLIGLLENELLETNYQEEKTTDEFGQQESLHHHEKLSSLISTILSTNSSSSPVVVFDPSLIPPTISHKTQPINSLAIELLVDTKRSQIFKANRIDGFDFLFFFL